MTERFPELNKNNSMIDNYNDSYSPIFNRIQIYTVKNKETLNTKIFLILIKY